MALLRKEDALLRALGGDRVWRSTVRERQNSSCLQVETDDGITILPYAYFQEARCRRDGATWEIMLYWPWVILSLTGRNMENLPGLIAEHDLASIKFQPDGERVERDDRPEFESVTLTARSQDPVLPPPIEAGPNAIHRQTYSI